MQLIYWEIVTVPNERMAFDQLDDMQPKKKI